jgi:Cu-processing system permease protein
MRKIIFLVLMDIVKNKIVVAYALILAILSWGVFMLEDSSNKGLLTLLNVVLLVVPLMSLLFSTIYLYNSAEFVELLISQPVKRKTIWLSLYSGLSLSLTSAFLLAAGLPLFLFCDFTSAFILVVTGCLITWIFTSIAFLSAIKSRDKAKGIGIAIMLWLYFALLFDGLVLFLLFQFGEYPIEKPMVLLTILSPLDLTRILNLLQMDASALMGYTGAIFNNYFGTELGMLLAFLVLVAWALVPLIVSFKIFNKKDL